MKNLPHPLIRVIGFDVWRSQLPAKVPCSPAHIPSARASGFEEFRSAQHPPAIRPLLRSPKRKLRETALIDSQTAFPRLAPRVSRSSVPPISRQPAARPLLRSPKRKLRETALIDSQTAFPQPRNPVPLTAPTKPGPGVFRKPSTLEPFETPPLRVLRAFVVNSHQQP